MMAAAKKGSFVKKRRSDLTTRNRWPEPDPEPSPHSTETRRSLRPRQRRYLADFEDEFDLEEEEDEEESRGGRKLKLVLKVPPISTGRCRDSSPVTAPKSRRVVPDRRVSPPSDYSPSTSQSATSASRDIDDEDEDETVQPLKKRRIERVRELDGYGHGEERRGDVIRRPIRAVSGTPMPERSMLEAILNTLQKKDTYGVFNQPVDPDELPDYHDVIEHPMDFGTVRKKLASSRYVSFEQFEDDVFLICSNAMQYNAPDTIYFRQARSIQDMARRNFQGIRADLISSGAERKSEENIRSASIEKNKIKKVHSGIASRTSSFCVSLEKTTPSQPCKDAQEPLCCDNPLMEKTTIKKHYRTPPEPHTYDISSMEKKTLWKPQYRTTPEPPRSDIFFMDKKTLKKSHYKTAPKSRGSDVSSMEKKTLKKPHHRTAPEARVSYVSSIEKKKAKNPQYSPVHESPDSDHSYMEEKPESKPLFKTEPDPEPAGYDISSREKTTSVNAFQCRTELEPLCSDISSRDKKTQEEHKSRIAPEPLDSEISSGATLTSSAGTLTDLSKIHINGNALAADPCTGLSTVEVGDTALVGDTSIGSPMMKDGGIERSVSINESADGSSPSENILEKPDDVQAKSSPSKRELRPFLNRRVTYTLDDQPVVETDSVFDVLEGETKQLVSVGLDSEYSYARSLARFSSFLGPVAWEIASKKIEQALPPGVKFGPGWVGEYEPVLTPVLSPGSSMRQLPVKRRGMGNEVKLEAVPAVSRKNGNGMTSQISNGQCKDASFGPMSPMTIGMPSYSSSNPLKEMSERSRAQKKGTFGANPEMQSCTSRTAPQQQKNEPAVCRLDICPEAPKSVHPSLSLKGLTQVRGETQKQQQPKTRVAQMQGETQKQQHLKNQVAGDLVKAYNNETARSRPEIYAEAHASTSPEITYLGNSQLQTETLKQPDAVASQRRNDSLGMNFGNLDSWKSHDIGQITPFSIITNHPPGVQYSLARGSQEHAINDPLRWMNPTGNLSTQPNTSNRCSNNLQQSMPTGQVPKRENPNAAAAAAQAWMSIGASAEWKPVNGGGLPNKQAGYPPLNPAWKTPGHASRVYEEANIKPEPLPGVPENTQTQAKGLVFYPQLMSNDLSRLRSPWQDLAPHNKQKDTLPPDLNISFQPPVSPARSSSGILRDSQQPDLALQL